MSGLLLTSAGRVGDDLLPEGLGLPERPRHHPHQVLHRECDEGVEGVTFVAPLDDGIRSISSRARGNHPYTALSTEKGARNFTFCDLSLVCSFDKL